MIYQQILQAHKTGRKLLAVLLDPDKINNSFYRESLSVINESMIDFVLVGGSTVQEGVTQKLVASLKDECKKPIILFPGEVGQVTPEADAILFLSLISGRNPEYLIDQQVRAVPQLKRANLEVIPTGYILINGGTETSVERVSKTKALDSNRYEEIVHTACAGMYMGQKLIYLEAGSGAKHPVKAQIIAAVKQSIDIPLIVGGGIRTPEQLELAFSNGADVVVIGTAFENNTDVLQKMMKNERID